MEELKTETSDTDSEDSYSISFLCQAQLLDEDYFGKKDNVDELLENEIKTDIGFKDDKKIRYEFKKLYIETSNSEDKDSDNILTEISTTYNTSSIACDTYSKNFSSQDCLARHKFSHSSKRSRGQFVCEICGKFFLQKHNLSKHMRIHTGVQPYVCHICSKSFSDKSNFNRHIRRHSGHRPFSCVICSKTFTEKVILSKHMQTHSRDHPFSCNFCSKSFYSKTILANHVRTHTGDRPFICDICSKSFSQKSALTRHFNTHTDFL